MSQKRQQTPVSFSLWLQVTLPQLSLLETALSSMPRIEVFVMRRQSRSPGDVFEVGACRKCHGHDTVWHGAS